MNIFYTFPVTHRLSSGIIRFRMIASIPEILSLSWTWQVIYDAPPGAAVGFSRDRCYDRLASARYFRPSLTVDAREQVSNSSTPTKPSSRQPATASPTPRIINPRLPRCYLRRSMHFESLVTSPGMSLVYCPPNRGYAETYMTSRSNPSILPLKTWFFPFPRLATIHRLKSDQLI